MIFIYFPRWKGRTGRDISRSSWTRTGGQLHYIQRGPRNSDSTADQEEAGIRAPLEYAGSLLFISEDAAWAFQNEIYRANSYEGTVTE
jgi:hypothetical protein